MCTENSDSMIKKALKSLCCNHGWSYGVFWRFDQRNSLLLTMEDAYFEEQLGFVTDNMLLQVHMLGSGNIGQVAFTKQHRWIYSDAHPREKNPVGSIDIQDIFQDDSELHQQFSFGIQTIAVIFVEPRGVVQFGSTEKILERMEFVNQTKRVFQDMESGDGILLSENAPSSSNIEIYGPSGWWFTSSISLGNSYIGNPKPMHCISSKNFLGTTGSSTNLTLSSPFTSDYEQKTPLIWNSSHPGNQFQMAQTGAPAKLSCNSSTQLQQSTTFVNHSAVQTPCVSTRNSGDSTLTSFKQQLPSEMMLQGSQDVFAGNPNNLISCRNTVQICPDSTYTSVHSTGELIDIKNSSQCSSGILMNHQHSALLFHENENKVPERLTNPCTFQELYQPSNCAISPPKSCTLDNLSQWFVPSPEPSINPLETTLNDDRSQAFRVTSSLSSLNGAQVLNKIPISHPANSLQSSITSTFTSDGKERCSNIDNDLFYNLGLDFDCGQAGNILDDLPMPVMSDGLLDFSTDTSECISKKQVGSMVGPQKGLFSKLGLEQILGVISGNSNSAARTSFRDALSSPTKRRRTGSFSVSSDQVQLAGHSCFDGNINLLHPVYKLDRMNNLEPKKEVIPKSELDSWIGDRHSMNSRGSIVSQPKSEEPGKVTKKKAKPGSRPRPKDRQQIQECVQELRELIPNGVKMSIDSLLARTIKHLLFLQSVTKHADKLRQTDEPKMIFQENGLATKDSGVTWAYEFGAQTMVCPLVVEDLSPPGQMLIEMLCEEQGFFLEIVDIIQGFGLTILKGVMEVQENKIWARFIVETEASRQVTRVEIFMALVQLLEPTATNGITNGMNASNQLGNVINGRATLFDSYQQPVVPLPVSLADMLC